jgi:predicted DNA-binding transcriptional regulator YafY
VLRLGGAATVVQPADLAAEVAADAAAALAAYGVSR